MSRSITEGVRREVLDNGLRVLLRHSSAAPVAAVVAHVAVGYFHEPDQWSGISHVIEHMLFKGTERRPGEEQIAREVRALGGILNAGTYYEETSYYVTLPAEHARAAVEILADMLARPLLRPDSLEREIQVILQESRQKRDNPRALLTESLYARAFDRHRIRRWRIGTDEVLRSLTVSDLRAFLDQTYRPANIVLAIVGDINPDSLLAEAARSWGAMPAGTLLKEDSPAEPPRAEFRCGRLCAPIEQRLLQFCLPAPPLLSPDAPALMALDAILSDGRSSRLYRALREERRLVNAAWSGYEAFQNLGVFTLGADIPEDDPLPAEAALAEEVERLRRTPADDAELARVKTRMESRRLFAQEEVLGMARTLAWHEAAGDYLLADEIPARIRALEPSDIQRAAARWMDLSRATLLEELPEGSCAPVRTPEEVLEAIRPAFRAPEIVMPSGLRIHDLRLDSGTRLLVRPRADLPVVAIQVLHGGGRRGERPETAGITSLLCKSQLKGTASRTAQEIALEVESLGSGIGVLQAPDYYGFSLKVLKSRLEDALPVLADVLRRPAFPPEEVEKEKQSVYAEIRRHHDSMMSRALDLFHRACYGSQPYGLPAAGDAEAAAALTADDLAAWHARWSRGPNTVIAVVGPVEPREAAALLERLAPDATEPAPPCQPSLPGEPRQEEVLIERNQTAAVLGFPGAPAAGEDRPALDLLARICGGLAGRFFAAVRVDNALAYAVTALHLSRLDSGSFLAYTATAPERAEDARDILLAECARLLREPPDAAEITSAKTALRASHAIGMQTFFAQAAEMAVLAMMGQDPEEAERFLERVDALTRDDLLRAAERINAGPWWRGVVRGTGHR